MQTLNQIRFAPVYKPMNQGNIISFFSTFLYHATINYLEIFTLHDYINILSTWTMFWDLECLMVIFDFFKSIMFSSTWGVYNVANASIDVGPFPNTITVRS